MNLHPLVNKLVVIPARLNSSRFPNKPLFKIKGVSLIRHCIERAKMLGPSFQVVLATCDKEIAEEGRSANVDVVMTSPEHERATDRVAEALSIIRKTRDTIYDCIVMIQGDEPLFSPSELSNAVEFFQSHSIDVLNIVWQSSNPLYVNDPNRIKVVCTVSGRAIYFSRSNIPYQLGRHKAVQSRLIQSGIIIFREKSLEEFQSMSSTALEIAESVDMNRYIDMEIPVMIFRVCTEMPGVDTHEDAKHVAKLMSEDVFFIRYKQC